MSCATIMVILDRSRPIPVMFSIESAHQRAARGAARAGLICVNGYARWASKLEYRPRQTDLASAPARRRQMKTDLQIKLDVSDELAWDPAVDAATVGVEVNHGVVTLSGHLRTYVEKLAAERAAERVAGVKAVVVELDVRVPGAHDDEAIAEAARAALQWHAGLPRLRHQGARRESAGCRWLARWNGLISGSLPSVLSSICAAWLA
ncbi:BON domain-containing protein [Cupriavidus basilensis]